MKRRLLTLCTMTISLLLGLSSTAFACGGLIAFHHAEVLGRATTLAAWTNGLEHYVTGFEFAGAADSFGYIIPLPAVPSKIVKGGDWMLERLDREAFPPKVILDDLRASRAASSVQVLQHVKIDTLDIKVVRGGGRDVAAWARQHNFDLTPDSDSILASYKANIFALAKFDNASASRRFTTGQGVVIDFEIPLPGPWIPLRILSLGKVAAENVDAHLFLLTPTQPNLTPDPEDLRGMRVAYNGWASQSLISDLRSDTGTKWVPERMWFTALALSAPAPSVRYDLAGFKGIQPVAFPTSEREAPWIVIGAALAAVVAGFIVRKRVRDLKR
ncbi:MAG: hypothetical protein ACYDCC_03330 [Actinomycetota bacterium]